MSLSLTLVNINRYRTINSSSSTTCSSCRKRPFLLLLGTGITLGPWRHGAGHQALTQHPPPQPNPTNHGYGRSGSRAAGQALTHHPPPQPTPTNHGHGRSGSRAAGHRSNRGVGRSIVCDLPLRVRQQIADGRHGLSVGLAVTETVATVERREAERAVAEGGRSATAGRGCRPARMQHVVLPAGRPRAAPLSTNGYLPRTLVRERTCIHWSAAD